MSTTPSATPTRVTVFWRPGCPYCMRLRAGLRRARIDVDEVNIWEDPEAALTVRSVAGGSETVPTVIFDGVALVNPSARRVIEELRDKAPDLLPPEIGSGSRARSRWRWLPIVK